MGREAARARSLVVLDAGVVIGVLDDTDPHFASAYTALEERSADELRLPASAYAEVLVRPARLGRLDIARSGIQLLGIVVEALSAAAAERAAELRARHRGLRFADALVLGYADSIEADLVLTTDRRLRRVDPRIEAIA
jgi:predicted nucleic acid-binding protein